MQFYAIVYGEPVAWSVGNFGNGRVYKKPKLLAHYLDVFTAVRNAWPPDLPRPYEGLLRLDIVALFKRPQRLYRQKDAEGAVYKPTRPDRDNLAKAIQDALQTEHDGFDPLLSDDSQIVIGETAKLYTEKDGEPRTIVAFDTSPESVADELERMGISSVVAATRTKR